MLIAGLLSVLAIVGAACGSNEPASSTSPGTSGTSGTSGDAGNDAGDDAGDAGPMVTLTLKTKPSTEVSACQLRGLSGPVSATLSGQGSP